MPHKGEQQSPPRGCCALFLSSNSYCFKSVNYLVHIWEREHGHACIGEDIHPLIRAGIQFIRIHRYAGQMKTGPALSHSPAGAVVNRNRGGWAPGRLSSGGALRSVAAARSASLLQCCPGGCQYEKVPGHRIDLASCFCRPEQSGRGGAVSWTGL